MTGYLAIVPIERGGRIWQVGDAFEPADHADADELVARGMIAPLKPGPIVAGDKVASDLVHREPAPVSVNRKP